ncbi:MAG: hypothetical protein JJU05_19260 [Verrucomicrobia bacterium]|nr:hypothetical protein [Verrucomicrobiota bacterium]
MNSINTFQYQRLVIAYHGCDVSTREHVVLGEEHLQKSDRPHDWLGHGIYFWEHGYDRALKWAQKKKRMGQIQNACVVGALIHLGNCYDLLDTQYTEVLEFMWPRFEEALKKKGHPLPENKPGFVGDKDHVKRIRDCAYLNWVIESTERAENTQFDTVRGLFPEGVAAFPGGSILKESHIQISVRNPGCILGYFMPKLS